MATIGQVKKLLDEHIEEDHDFQEETREFRKELQEHMIGTNDTLTGIKSTMDSWVQSKQDFKILWDERNEENGAKKMKAWLMNGAGAVGLVGIGAIITHYWP